MFRFFGKLLCAAALASVALAQSISIVQPAAGTTVDAGSSVVLELERSPSSASIQEVALVIGASSCAGGCSDPSQDLGTVVFTGVFAPQSTNGSGYAFESITVTVPNYYDGSVQINAAHFYLSGAYATPKLEYGTLSIDLRNGGG